ncbi:hypothetical protein [Actinopolymorpha singaporensis]|uniref:Uncharacterized protein n=1 Tax=Actinopolymorpha singaporensis TaxID=117157 RepID=A0A1H1PB51_9ACTN|nr:hypothetical protein [Actinopolymorpha singaporensis]SDS08383.1 hypothetical protein SAMN04489717_1567 [Actinopolymorpha singaporensis]
MPRKRGGRSNRARAVENVKPRIHQRWGAQLLLAFWRWLPELALAGTTGTVFVYLVQMDLPAWAAGSVIVAPVAVALVVPYSGRVLVAVFWVDVTRHRLRTFMAENGLRNRSGRLPWLLFIYPTRVGERAWMVLVGGICVEDVEERIRSLGSTCYARSGQVQVHRKWTHLIRIDITRRDPLDSKTPVESGLIPKGTEQALIPANIPTADQAAGVRASEWAVGIGLPLADSEDTTEIPSRMGVRGGAGGKANGQATDTTSTSGFAAAKETTRKRTTTRKETPAPTPDRPAPVLSASGEDVSDYV